MLHDESLQHRVGLRLGGVELRRELTELGPHVALLVGCELRKAREQCEVTSKIEIHDETELNSSGARPMQLDPSDERLLELRPVPRRGSGLYLDVLACRVRRLSIYPERTDRRIGNVDVFDTLHPKERLR